MILLRNNKEKIIAFLIIAIVIAGLFNFDGRINFKNNLDKESSGSNSSFTNPESSNKTYESSESTSSNK